MYGCVDAPRPTLIAESACSALKRIKDACIKSNISSVFLKELSRFISNVYNNG